jgi:hypothetical protein
VAAYQADSEPITRQAARDEDHFGAEPADPFALVGEVIKADLPEFPCPAHRFDPISPGP